MLATKINYGEVMVGSYAQKIIIKDIIGLSELQVHNFRYHASRLTMDELLDKGVYVQATPEQSNSVISMKDSTPMDRYFFTAHSDVQLKKRAFWNEREVAQLVATADYCRKLTWKGYPRLTYTIGIKGGDKEIVIAFGADKMGDFLEVVTVINKEVRR